MMRPAMPYDTTITWILSYLYAVILWFFHPRDLEPTHQRGKACNCHEPVILRD